MRNGILYTGAAILLSAILGSWLYLGEVNKSKTEYKKLEHAFSNPVSYTLKRGDTLFGISQGTLKGCNDLNGINWARVKEKIKSENYLATDRIYEGQRLKVPVCFKTKPNQ